MDLIVVGARRESLGWAVTAIARDKGYRVMTAGLHNEDLHVDLTSPGNVANLVRTIRPRHIVCTAGINIGGTVRGGSWWTSLGTQAEVNYLGPMTLLGFWAEQQQHRDPAFPAHFTAITSNSAFIPRSQSGGYCASKAALEMGLRCAARELAGGPMVVYSYAPGWLEGTPMSEEVSERIAAAALRHRIPGGRGIPIGALAEMIVKNLHHGHELNGTCFRIDGGEI